VFIFSACLAFAADPFDDPFGDDPVKVSTSIHVSDTLAGVTLGSVLVLEHWESLPNGKATRNLVVASISGTLTASFCGDRVAALSFTSGWTNSVENSVARSINNTSGSHSQQSKSTSLSVGGAISQAVAVVSPSGLAARVSGSASSLDVSAARSNATQSSITQQDGQDAVVMLASAEDIRTLNPKKEATDSFLLLMDAMKSTGWTMGYVMGDTPNDLYQQRAFTKSGARRVLVLACSTPDALGLFRCGVELSTREACTDGI
jgi:hypothetical protein